jgi:anti-sigma regulatory factor (Ser/Thr protein kinase)
MNAPTGTTARRRFADHHPHPPEPPPGRPPRAVLDLGALPTAPGCARAWTREILREWSMVGMSGTVELIVSELTTNAMLTSRREGRLFIRLILTLDQGEVAILVRDFSAAIPQPGNAGADDENGRGLLLVQAMSDRSGWYPAEDGAPGKVVWAVTRSE